jgi:hypothetical protein
MADQPRAIGRLVFTLLACFLLPCAAALGAAPDWQGTHDRLVARLRALEGREGAFGPAYRPLYHAALGWYEAWGGRNSDPVDDNMVSPEKYASELAGALENGRNFFADHPGASFPLAFERTLPSGQTVTCNYWLNLPAGFPETGKTYPLIVGLHGSGWLGHKISFVRGNGPGQPFFSVTPIDQAGPWQIDFLNAYLDELEAMLPIDHDRIYLEGHSLGAMATWEWAMANPERFAAISPRDGEGEPYRAVRLKNVPAWVIHGEKDDVIASGFAEEMITALRACGGTAKYSLLPGAPHNLPKDFDQAAVISWYLQHSRSHEPPGLDPREDLQLNDAGVSQWKVIGVPGGIYWKSAVLGTPGRDWGLRPPAGPLFKRIQSKGQLVGEPVRRLYDHSSTDSSLWLAAPPALQAEAAADPAAVPLPARREARFYFQGSYREGLRHARAVSAELQAEGKPVSGRIWVTQLSLWGNTPRGIAEFWVELR